MDKRLFIRQVRSWDSKQVARALAAEPELSRYVDQIGKTPLHHCAGINVQNAKSSARESVKTAEALIVAGVDVNAIRVIVDEGEEFEATALWYAVAWGKNLELARFLLEKGAEPKNCMWSACWDQNAKMAELLLSFGAAVDPVFHGETPLLQIVKSKRFKLLKWLVGNGANINFQDPSGFTALHYAVKRNHNIGQLRELLELGANPTLRAENGTTPISLARRLGKAKVAAMLEEARKQ